jgi:hypothetical protein
MDLKIEPDALNTPERARSRFPGVACDTRDDAGGIKAPASDPR